MKHHLVLAAESRLRAAEETWPADAQYKLGDAVAKKGRASWRGRIVGWYRTDLTALGYAVESHFEPGSVQIYPEDALLPWTSPPAREALPPVAADWAARLAGDLDPQSAPDGDHLLRVIHADLELQGRADPLRAVTVFHRNLVLSAVAKAIRTNLRFVGREAAP